MHPTIAAAHRPTNEGDHAIGVGEGPDGERSCIAAASVTKEVSPMQTLRASAIAVPFVVLALVVAVLSVIIGAGT
jgi:hypothetical protein